MSLPMPATPLIGRQREIDTVRTLLERAMPRLLTFTGPPGVGKTRLCLEIAQQLITSALAPATQPLQNFADGAYFVSLAPLQEANQVADAIVRALGLQDAAEGNALDQLRIALRQRHCLLLLDNFEHLMAAAPLVAELLKSAPGLTLFVTSRLPLRLSGEQEYPVPPLTLPAESAQAMEEMLQSPSVALFVARARTVKVDFRVTPADAPIIAHICRRLDGVPLAIELAAARCKLLPLPALLARLSNRLGMLTQGARDLPVRQQTLRAAIAWSYDLLSPAEQVIFGRLGIFVGGWSLETAEAVCAITPDEDVLSVLAILLDHSLIYLIPTGNGQPRYTMLEMIGDYAREQLQAGAHETEMRQRHAAYYLSLAQKIPLALEIPIQDWYDQLALEFNNLRAALQRSAAQGDRALTVALVISLSRFWWERGHFNESWHWVHAALDLELQPFGVNALEYRRAPFPLPPTPERANLLYQAAFDYWIAGEWDDAIAIAEQSLLLFQALDDRRGESWLTRLLAMVLIDQGDWRRAQPMAESSLRHCQAVGDRGGIGFAQLLLGQIFFYGGEVQRSTQMLQQCESTLRQIGQIEGLFFYLRLTAEIAIQQGAAAAAIPKLEESVALARQIDHKTGVVVGLLTLSVALLTLGDRQAALHKTEQALQLLQKNGLRNGMSSGYAIFAKLADELQLYREALCFWRMSEDLRLQNSAILSRHSVVEQLRYALIERFGAPHYLTAQNAPNQPSLEAAIATLEAAVTNPPAAASFIPSQPGAPTQTSANKPTSPSPALAELTTREVDVLRLLAQGLTYNAIAAQLVVSPRTVDAHLRAIYGKLGVKSRHEATRLVVEQHLLEPKL